MFLRVRLLWVLGEGKLLFGWKLLSAMKFVHEMGVLCAELFLVAKFVHERGVLCAELLSVKKFVHEMGVPCAELGSRPSAAPSLPLLRHFALARLAEYSAALLHRRNNQHLLPIMECHCKDVV